MQVLIQGKQIQDQPQKDEYVHVLADKYARSILEATMDSPKSAIDLSTECGIPISTAYRRVQDLYAHKLLSISGSINQDGKKYFLYKSKIKSITIHFQSGMFEVEIIPNQVQS